MLQKKVLQAGQGRDSRPLKGQNVRIALKTSLADGTVVEDLPGLSFTLGDGDVIQVKVGGEYTPSKVNLAILKTILVVLLLTIFTFTLFYLFLFISISFYYYLLGIILLIVLFTELTRYHY